MMTIETWVFVVLYLAFGFVSMLFGAAVMKYHYDGIPDEYMQDQEEEQEEGEHDAL